MPMRRCRTPAQQQSARGAGGERGGEGAVLRRSHTKSQVKKGSSKVRRERRAR